MILRIKKFVNYAKSPTEQLKKRRPNCGIKGGVNTLSNKKCLVGRMVMNQSALYSSDLGECFTYSERMLSCLRRIENFLRASEVKVFAKNSHKVAGSAELQRLEFQKIHSKVTFPSIKNVSWVIRS